DIDRDLLREIALRHRGRHLRDVAHLTGQVGRHRVHVVGQILPGPRDPRHLRLTAELAIGTHLASNTRYFGSKRVQLVHHRIDGALQFQYLALDVDGDLPREIALRHRGRHIRDVAHLTGQVGRHRVHIVGQVLPRARYARHLRLAAQFSFGTHFTCDARYFGGKGIQLIHHRVDGALQFEYLAPDIDRDLLREIALRHRGRHLRDVAHLTGQVGRHRVHVVGQILPGPRDPRHLRLTAELAIGTHLASNTRYFGSKRVQLVHHRVDGALQFQYLALDVDGDLLQEIPLRHRGRHIRDVAHLTSQVGRHRVHVVGHVLPRACYARHSCLAAQLSLRANLTRHPRYFGSECVQLVDHRVDGALHLQYFALGVHR